MSTIPQPRLFQAVGRQVTPRAEWVEIQVKTVLNRVQAMPFEWSINPYRGCSHGCPFCYARRTHWFLDQDGVNDWASRVFVKVNAPDVLRTELARRTWKRELVALGTATDPYQAAEGRYHLTRRILEALRDFRTPVSIVTRSAMVLRDIDVLRELTRRAAATVCVSIATTDERLARELEPTVAPPAQRLRAVARLSEAGIRTGVLIAPIVPGLTADARSLEAVIRAARDHGAHFVGNIVLHLGEVTRDAFLGFLRERYPALVPLYERLYGRKYAPRAYQERIARLVAGYKARLGMRQERYAATPRPDEQVQLF